MISSQRSDPAGHSSAGSDDRPKRLIERFRAAIRERHYRRRTEQAYWYWIRYFIRFHGKRHPAEMGGDEVSAFLSWLATDREVAAATQNQALAALLFLYKHVLCVDLPWLGGLVRAQRPVRLPTVLTEAEVRRLLEHTQGTGRLIAGLLYGAGLRQIVVRDGKGAKDRVTMLPEKLVQPLQEHFGRVRALHQRDRVWRGVAAARACAQVSARAARVGLAVRLSVGESLGRPRSGLTRRHHLHPDTVSRLVKRAAQRARSRSR